VRKAAIGYIKEKNIALRQRVHALLPGKKDISRKEFGSS